MFAVRFTALLCLAALLMAPAMAQSAPGAANLAAFHTAKAGATCTACHPDGDPASLVPEAALAAANRQCQACHGDAAQMARLSQPKLADPNINPHASHLVAVDCTVCHGGHAATSVSYCLQCHAFTMPMPQLAGIASK